MKIQHNGTTLFLIMEPSLKSPADIAAHTLHHDRFKLSECLVIVHFFQIAVFVKGTDHLSYHDVHSCFFLCLQKQFSFFSGQADRFFYQNIHALFHSCYGMLCMQVAWKADMYCIQIFTFDQLHSICICPRFGKFCCCFL